MSQHLHLFASEYSSPGTTSISSSSSINSNFQSECSFKYVQLQDYFQKSDSVETKNEQKLQFNNYCSQFLSLNEEFSTISTNSQYNITVKKSMEQYTSNFSHIDQDKTEKHTFQSQIILQGQRTIQQQQKELYWIQPYLKNEMVLQSLGFKKSEVMKENIILQKLVQNNFLQLKKQQEKSEICQNSDISFPGNYYNSQEVQDKINKKLFGSKVNQKIKNPSKIFITILIRFLKQHGIVNVNMPSNLREKLLQMVENCRISSRIIEGNKIIRSDKFSKIHYGVLFLKVTEKNLKQICSSYKLQKLHQKVLGLNLEYYKQTNQPLEEQQQYRTRLIQRSKKISKQKQQIIPERCSFTEVKAKKNKNIQFEIISQNNVCRKFNCSEMNQVQQQCSEDDIEYYNFLKECLYNIVNQHLKDNLVGQNKEDSDICDRLQIDQQGQQFFDKLFSGLSLLNQGVMVKRF